MDLTKRYQDSNDNPCDILQMVKREPEWAANRIQAGEEAEKALNYYRSGMLEIKPQYIPARVRLYGVACGDGPFAGTRAAAGEYDCTCNQWGAVSITASNGQMLGLRLNEFEPITWRENDKA